MEPFVKLVNITIRVNPELWKLYKDLQKRRGVLLMRAVEDMLKAALAEDASNAPATNATNNAADPT